MSSIDFLTCENCGKRYKRVITRFPAKLEETRFWDTYYYCPYCKKMHDIRLASDEDVSTFELNEKE